MSRKTAKEYAQERRDQEVSARTRLKRVIPGYLFAGKLADGDKTFSISAKIMMAATECIDQLLMAPRSSKPEVNHRRKDGMSASLPFRDPRVAMLRQAMLRCVQTAEQKACEANGEEGELAEIFEKGYDLLVDFNDMLQQGGMTDMQRTKWAQEQEAWGKGFYLQK